MIRNYIVSSVQIEGWGSDLELRMLHPAPRTNRFPIALWCFLSRGRFCFLVNQLKIWRLATPWAEECSGKNVGRKRWEAIFWWVSCWQAPGPWESRGVGISLIGEQPERQKQCCDLLVVTPRSPLEQHRPPAVGYATTGPRLSAVHYLLSCFNPAANMYYYSQGKFSSRETISFIQD